MKLPPSRAAAIKKDQQLLYSVEGCGTLPAHISNLGELITDMQFFTGIHHPSKASAVALAMVSANSLRHRRSHFPVNEWIMDSGAFTTVTKHGGYPNGVEEYAEIIRRFADCGNLLAAVAQDFMCESFVLERTGLTVHDHQILTVQRYDSLKVADTAGVEIMPVLQGYAPAEYVEHLCMYGHRLIPGMWVGVGSVCKRNSNPGSVVSVLEAIHTVRPDLRLHGFGVKITALRNERVRELFYSTDSMAWSFAARMQGRDSNDIQEAVRYAERVNSQPLQRVLF